MVNPTKKKELQFGKVSMKPASKKSNEDYYAHSTNSIKSKKNFHIFIIADGMGGHSLGDAASYYAVNFVLKWWRSNVWMHDSPDEFFKECQESLIDVFHEINQRLIEIGILEEKKIGTTLSVLILTDNEYFICHIGDTRIYRFREKILKSENPTDDTIDLNEEKSFIQLSVDHSWASMQIENGSMTVKEAQSHGKAHYLTQCMGIKGDIEPYTASGSFTDTDYFLLCTDGFHNLFRDEELMEQWSKKLDEDAQMQDISDHFYTMAKKADYRDDVSILTVNISERTED